MERNLQVDPSTKTTPTEKLNHKISTCQEFKLMIFTYLHKYLPVKIRRLPNLLESTLRFQHHPTIPIRPCHHSKIGVLYPLLLKPFIMPKESLTQSNTSVHLAPDNKVRTTLKFKKANR